MARTKEQDAAYQRRRRRLKKLEKGGIVVDPHAACDDRILVQALAIKGLKAQVAEKDRIIAALREELADPLKGVFG